MTTFEAWLLWQMHGAPGGHPLPHAYPDVVAHLLAQGWCVLRRGTLHITDLGLVTLGREYITFSTDPATQARIQQRGPLSRIQQQHVLDIVASSVERSSSAHTHPPPDAA